MELRELIRLWREHAGMTPTQLAAACGVSDVAVYYWEQGKTAPTHANVGKIATACGTTPPGFWGGPPKRARRRRAS